MHVLQRHIMLLSDQDSSAATPDKLIFMYSCHLLQGAAGIRGLPDTEEQMQKYGSKLWPNKF